MSTALYILPRLWACEAPQPARKPTLVAKPKPVVERPAEPIAPRLAFYRKYTEGLLRRYLRFSLETGRVPSLLSREMFGGKVSHYRVHSFEDVVIFVHDVEKCLSLLTQQQQTLITRIAVQGYTQGEAVLLLRIPLRTIKRNYGRAIDALTAVFLQTKMLIPLEVCQADDLSEEA
ncbi:sigma-70 RNA polymerase sigma factor region 4 domain-containing protein [Granulicella arctica]|uniref:sigma factor-like helix-turn-helix DNA-binding protein n=1 Tax=Granulicella arctica TaxID=940613 RepID=UPI0021DF4ECF|nr:sigma factor-like helix-turn-helix DNA-binding protein [Granulicella arctica]